MFYLNLDISELEDLMALGGVAESEMKSAARRLTTQTRAKIIELANERLHSRRNPFIKALTHFQVDEHTFVVNLDASARWIDEGMSEHSMVKDLLKPGQGKKIHTTKTGPNKGATWTVIPFQLNKGKQDMTPAQQSLLSTVKKELASMDKTVTPNKIEMNASGTPKLGLVRTLDIMKAPTNTGRFAHGMGAGPIGEVAQGPTGIPLLKGIRVYQKEMDDGNGGKKVGRFVMTFRIVSSKHEAEGRWRHPGLQATNLLEEGMKWALEQWSSKVAPEIVSRIVTKLS